MEWWKEITAYEIYPRSFQDSNGDGFGDIPGIISRLPELQDLGIGLIWLAPVYPSPDADNGYDIADYCAVDGRYGSMADMERLFAEAARRGIRVIMDLVINHTSSEHEWFRQSRDPASPYRDYYIWKKPKGFDKNGRPLPPNNWTGFFMEDVWEFDEKSGEFYLHLFDKKQPDLNYRNQAVIEEVKKIMRFWLAKGAAGFRCDVINIIYKESFADGKPSITVRGLEHFKGREGTHRILRELRAEVLEGAGALTVGETVMVNVEEARLLCEKERGELDMLFYFEHLETDRVVARFIPKKFRASRFLKVLAAWQRGLSWNAVYFENHDQSRVVSHLGYDGKDKLLWERSAKTLCLLETTLRGTVFVYQGQEIGMTNFDFSSLDEVNDVESRHLDALMKKLRIPRFLRWKWIRASSRDNARTPMQWDGGEGAGFTAGKPWLGINKNHAEINYEAQKNDPDSVLSFYKMMIKLRREKALLREGEFIPLPVRGRAGNAIVAYKRQMAADSVSGGGAAFVVLNLSGEGFRVPRELRPLLAGSSPGGEKAAAVSSSGRKSPAGVILPWEGFLFMA